MPTYFNLDPLSHLGTLTRSLQFEFNSSKSNASFHPTWRPLKYLGHGHETWSHSGTARPILVSYHHTMYERIFHHPWVHFSILLVYI